MMKELVRNAALVAAVVIGLWVSGSLASHFLSGRGLLGPALADAVSPVLAVAGLLGSVVVCVLLGAVVSRAANTAVGMFATGVGIYGLSTRLAPASELFMLGHDGGAYFALAGEMVAWIVVALGAAALLFRLGGRLPDVGPDDAGRHPHPICSREAMKAVVAGLATLPIVLLVARSPDKGQVFGAAIAGGVATGFVGRLVTPTVQPIVMPAASMLAGTLGYLVVAIGALRGAPLADRALAGQLSPLALPMPADYLAGAFIGVSFGFGWAKSFLHAEKQGDAVVRRSAG